MNQDEHLARLRTCRERVEIVLNGLERIRQLEASLQELRELLHQQLKVERTARRDAILEADQAGLPKTRISREVGINRASLYNVLKGQPISE